MVVAAREVPRVRISDFANVPADGTGDGTAVCGSVSRVRHHADDGEMVVFYVLDPDSDGDGLRVRLLPDVVNGPGFAAGLLFSAFVPPDHGLAGFLMRRLLQVRMPGFAAGILDGILGAAFGSFLLWGLAAGYKAVRGHEGMGMGDVKMMAMKIGRAHV